MVLEENWGVAPERIAQFLLAQPDISRLSDGFQYCTCHVSLTPIQGTLMGKWPHMRTHIRIEGPEEKVRQIQKRIFLQFLSAGG